MDTAALEVVVLLGTAVWGLTLLARRLRVPPPIVLLLGGVPLAFVPALDGVHLEPALVLFIFLPALLYAESLDVSLNEIRANLRVVILSAVGLVVATAAAVAWIGHSLGLSWPVAWVLGAVLAPTDATAVAAVAGRMPRRQLTILRAESLINDGTALVILGIAVEVATGHDGVGAGGIAGDFLISYGGGLAVGLAAGWLNVRARGWIHDTLLSNTVSVLTPFVAFLAAEEIHASGVLGAVVAGLYVSQAGSLIITAQDRVRARQFWQLTSFLLNGTLFVLVGLELRTAVSDLTSYPIGTAVLDTLLVAAAVIGTRLVWTNTTPYVVRLLDRRPQQRARRVPFRQRQPGAWSGFRGAVSLAAALSIPSGVPGRDLIIIVTFGVIAITLGVQGLTLPAVLRWAKLPPDTSEDEYAYTERRAIDLALELLPREAARLRVEDEIADLVRAELRESRAELDGPDTDHVIPDEQEIADEGMGMAGPDDSGNGDSRDGGRVLRSGDQGPRASGRGPRSGDREPRAGGRGPSGGDRGPDGGDREPGGRSRREQYRELRLALVAEKRRAVVRMRDGKRIDDLVARRFESLLDAEELRLGAETTPTD